MSGTSPGAEGARTEAADGTVRAARTFVSVPPQKGLAGFRGMVNNVDGRRPAGGPLPEPGIREAGERSRARPIGHRNGVGERGDRA